MKATLIPSLLLGLAPTVLANVAPTVVVQSATMRPGTTLMDVVYRIDDPDDATVKVRALAFVDGVRSFANVIRPVTFVEGTDANIGDAITTNTPHTLTWDVAAEWDVELGQIKFEVLCRDSRRLLTVDWIDIPAAGGHPALKISENTPSDSQLLDALFWQYADGDPALTLANGVLSGNDNGGVFSTLQMVDGTGVQPYATAYCLEKMNLDYARQAEVDFTVNVAEATLQSPSNWHAFDRPYSGLSVVEAWGDVADDDPPLDLNPPFGPSGLHDATAVAAGMDHALALMSNGIVVGWGNNNRGQTNVPAGLTDAIAIAAGDEFGLALKSKGTVVAWGAQGVPAGLDNVIAISAGSHHCLALKSNGRVVGWGSNGAGQATVPAGLSNVVAISAGAAHSLVLKNDGTVVAWGDNDKGQIDVPAGLTNVTTISAGYLHNLAIRSDGTMVGWGLDDQGQATVPAGLTDVVAISGGVFENLALKADGTVVSWGNIWGIPAIVVPPAEQNPPYTIPRNGGVTNVTAICASTSGSGPQYALVVRRSP